MEHTYLRYECADSFGLVVSTPSSKAPPSNSILKCCTVTTSNKNSQQLQLLLTITGSSVTAYNTRTSLPIFKLAHREQLSGGVGTGRGLNSDQVTCLDVVTSTSISTTDPQQQSTLLKVATGWVDGVIRIFDVSDNDLRMATSHPLGLVHSLLHHNTDDDYDDGPNSNDDEFVMREPLLLNGHSNSSVRTIKFDSHGQRLASGGNDGSIVIWDVIAETGLFRLLGHKGGITEVRFVQLHSDTPLSLSSNLEEDGLITSCLDGLLKVWDLQQQCCIQTIANHRGEIWGTDCRNLVSKSSSDKQRWRLVSGGSDGLLRVWSVEPPSQTTSTTTPPAPETSVAERMDTTQSVVTDFLEVPQPANSSTDNVCMYRGTINPPPNVATSAEKVICVKFDEQPRGSKYLGVLRSDSKQVDIYKIKTVEESRKKQQRRLRRRKEKHHKKKEAGEGESIPTSRSGQKRGILDDPESSDDEEEENTKKALDEEHRLDPEQIKASDEFEYVTTVLASHKVRGFVFAPQKYKGQLVGIVCALATNAIETFALIRSNPSKESGKHPGAGVLVVAEKLPTMDVSGHPTGIRAVALSSDDALACTVSKNVIKVWNVQSRTCIHSLTPSPQFGKKSSSYGLCATFLPGNAHVVVGTREGHLLLIDIAAGNVVFAEEKAHQGAIWSVDLRRPTSSESTISLITGSADHSVKFWNIESEEAEDDPDGTGADRPILVHTRTLELKDDVVAARYSHSTDPSKRLVFVSALDNTIKVFFDDSLKLFLNLYGHSLPALAMDSSDDDAILASGGADKTVKIWGLDFGDTHRTLHGHQDSITDLRFVRRTHNFFTSSKDGTVRYWDGDRFEQILLLPGHCAEVNCLAVSRTGAFVLSGSMDRQVRVWERTKDIVFLQEERERELEQIFDKASGRDGPATASILDRKDEDSDDEGGGAADDQPQSEAAVQRSVLSVAAGDRLLEGLERADQEAKEVYVWNKANPDKKKQPTPLLLGLEPAHYVLWLLRTIKSADLEASLLVLPLTHIERLIYYCTVLLKQGRGVELCAKVAIFLVNVHQNQLAASQSTAPPLRELRRLLRLRLAESRDVVGYNIAALKLVARIAHDKKQSFLSTTDDTQTKNIWAGLGFGSDIAAAMEGKSRGKSKARR